MDGVLGGFGHVSSADIRESERFLSKVCVVTLRQWHITAVAC